MAVLLWKHRKTRAAARDAVQTELRNLGHDGKVKWKDDSANVSVGFGTVLSAAGEITDESVVLHKCGGAFGGLVLEKCEVILERLFPNGKVT